jgi:mannose-1-phosphate guanylyltransferase
VTKTTAASRPPVERPSQAVLLTAGLGTRLRPLTDVRAKPAIPVAGEPLIRRIIAWLASHGVTDLVLNLHHKPETIAAVVGDGSDLHVRARYSWEQPRILGSAGGPRRALDILGAGGSVFVINGDTLTDLDLGRVADAHAAAGALVTLALVPNREFDRYGGVRLDDRDAVTGFVPRGPRAEGSWHFVGVQIAHPSVFQVVAAGSAASSIGGIYDDLIRTRPGAVHGFRSNAAFWDVGTTADYLRTSRAFAGAGAAAAVPGDRAAIAPSARVTGSILWDHVEVGADAIVEECIVTDGVRVPAGAAYRRSILVQAAEDDRPRVFSLVS